MSEKSGTSRRRRGMKDPPRQTVDKPTTNRRQIDDRTTLEDADAINDRAAFFRVPQQLQDRWMRRCHREDVHIDKAACVQLERALLRPCSVMRVTGGIDEDRDWKAAALRLAAAYRKRESDELD